MQAEMLKSNNQEGFTFLEMLIVLSVFAVVSAIVWMGAINIYREKTVDLFFLQLEKDLLYIQQRALMRKETIYLFWYPDQHYYEAELSGLKGELFERRYDKNINVEPTTMKFPIEYTQNGFVNQSGSILINYNNKTYKMIFNLGRGRFRVEEFKRVYTR